MTHTVTNAVPSAWILHLGAHGLHEQPAYLQCYVPGTIISNNMLYVVLRLISTTILRGWYIEILVLQVRELRHREIRKLSHDPRARKW